MLYGRDVERARIGALLEQARACTAEPVHEAPDRQVGVLIFTSGTIGTAKAVMHSHFALVNLGRVMTRSRHTRPGDTYTGATPMFGANANTTSAIETIHAVWVRKPRT